MMGVLVGSGLPKSALTSRSISGFAASKAGSTNCAR